MFLHNFKYSLKILFKNKPLIFWTFAFPLILGTFFYLAFSDFENSEKFKVIDIAIINNDEFENNKVYKETYKKLGDKNNKDRIFNIKYVSSPKAKKLLDEKEIIGYLELIDNKPNIVVLNNSIEETVFKYVVEEITQTTDIISKLSEKEITNQMVQGNLVIDYEKIYKEVYELTNDSKYNASIKNVSNSNLSYTMIEFYTLIAMACLYGAVLGMTVINQNLANMSNKGKRISVAPIKKSKLLLSGVLASYVTSLVGLLLLFIYTIFVLKVDYGNNLLLIIILTLCGALAGLTFGIAVASLLKANENVKTGIIISISMLGCFFSGMMGITMKYIIDKYVPIINKLNPASMITDGFYSLYYYDTFDRYYFAIFSLLVFSAVMILISIYSLRRQKYDSI